MRDKNLIPLQNANAFQLTTDGKKGDWLIRENETGRELFRFNGRISDEDVFAILDFAREFELAALNVGMQEQKKIQDAALEQQNMALRATLEAANHRNAFLAETVERLTIGDDNGDSRTD